MENTLGNHSNIWAVKSKFFLTRALIYASFLFIPVWVQKTLDLNQGIQVFVMFCYIMFMAGQWFMLGKEIDHRFSIYFRVNSSIDRVLYRLLLGMACIMFYFNILDFFPSKWALNFFWTTWVILGLFYSWPTRGKIIKESVSTNFGEFRYLDSFEKTLVGLILLVFAVSIPELPNLTGIEALKLFFDPMERMAPQYWSFIKINYYPFFKYPQLFKLAWCMHFFVVGTGLFLIAIYALLRYFVSRRLSLLGVFVVISSWSFSKILANNFGEAVFTTFSLIWVWSLLWASKSSSYRVGLGIGLIGFLGTAISLGNIFLFAMQFPLLYLLFLNEKTKWFRKKFMRYMLIGGGLGLLILILNWERLEVFPTSGGVILAQLADFIERKAFFVLAPLGVVALWLKLWLPNMGMLKNIIIDKQRYFKLLIMIGVLFLASLFLTPYGVKSYGLMWLLAVFSLVPLEFIFQALSRLRSKRNFIYLSYILICLLDSHFEGRLKIFLKLFES